MSFPGYKNLFSPKIGLILIFIGAFFLIGAIGLSLNGRSANLAFDKAPEAIGAVTDEDLPERILIPDLKISLQVFPTKVVNDDWQVSKTGASYLLGSGIPGKSGNSVIYGHNKKKLFGPLLRIKNGTKIEIENKKKEKFVFEVVEMKLVTPKQVEVLSATDEPILTLYTCAGLMDAKRFVVIAKLKPGLR